MNKSPVKRGAFYVPKSMESGTPIYRTLLPSVAVKW